MKIGDKEIEIKGHGKCSQCGKKFQGEPYGVYLAMKRHLEDTGHKVWN